MPVKEIKITAGGSKYIRLTDKRSDTVPLYATVVSEDGTEKTLTYPDVSAKSKKTQYAEIADGNIIPVSEGEAEFEVSFRFGGEDYTQSASLTVIRGKSRASYMTAEKAETARENVKKYDWARKEVYEKYISSADKYADKIDEIYDMIPSEGIPRGNVVGAEGDPDMFVCRYCGANLSLTGGHYPWHHDPLKHPWKIQCPECKRLFPSNDFAGFYKLGLNEYGEFDVNLAHKRNAELVAEGKDGFLKNILYPEKGEDWGVDDGFGYLPNDENGNPRVYENGVRERHTYIAEYVHSGLWYYPVKNGRALISDAVDSCAWAYFYTGEKKYGRCAAILLDRIADFYPYYDLLPYARNFWNSHGGGYRGKILGCIWETFAIAELFAIDYDLVFDMYDDEFVADYIRNKSRKIKMRHAKETPSQIRTNIEDGLLRTIFEGLCDCSIAGNFGFPQAANAAAAVVLDTMPETKKWLDYLMAPGWIRNLDYGEKCLGGGIDSQLINDVDHDGQGDEASGYNVAWHTSLIDIADILEGYDRYPVANLYKNPKFVKMFYSNIPLMLSYYTPGIGDTAWTAREGNWLPMRQAMTGYRVLGDYRFAQIMYKLNGDSAKGLRYDTRTKDPERLEKEVADVIRKYGEFEVRSELMSGFGFGKLCDGGKTENDDFYRASWMYFGSNSGHGHRDTLNLGMQSYGLNIMPDLGYPVRTGPDPNRLQWVSSTLSHNTAMVNEREQDVNTEVRGRVHHFADDGFTKLMDVSADYVYPETDIYRRSNIMVNVDGEVSYTVDFFRIKGGDDHLLSIHALSDEISAAEGAEFVPQTDKNGSYTGTYAGASVPYGNDPNSPNDWEYETKYPRGYSWLKNVNRAEKAGGTVSVDFAVKDFRGSVPTAKDVHLRTTLLGLDGENTSVSTADGEPPRSAKNSCIDTLKYVLVKKSGKNLDTLFTTVYEPYRRKRYIKSIEKIAMGDGVNSCAVKVVHNSGRIDYVMYSLDNSVTYHINEANIDFRGFAGVYTIENGKNTYRFVNDGDIIGTPTEIAGAFGGTVCAFTHEFAFGNEIVLDMDAGYTDEEVCDLCGEYVYIDNGADKRDAVYKIESASPRDGKLVLNIGLTTLIRRHIEKMNPEKGYVYNIEEGQRAYIPLSFNRSENPPRRW